MADHFPSTVIVQGSPVIAHESEHSAINDALLLKGMMPGRVVAITSQRAGFTVLVPDLQKSGSEQLCAGSALRRSPRARSRHSAPCQPE